MKKRWIAVVMIAVGCGGPQSTSNPEVADDGKNEHATETAGEHGRPSEEPAEEPEPTICAWPSTLLLDGGRYVHNRTSEPCDTVTFVVSTTEQLPAGLAAFTDANTQLGGEHIELEIGTAAKVYDSRDDVLSDPEAGADAAKIIPKDFDFESKSLARYDVLHTVVVHCRDGMLGLTGKQAKAAMKAEEKWRKQAAKLATQWRFVAGATSEVHDIVVLDPVLPAERYHQANPGMCTESWMVQPALTDVPRGADVRLLAR